MLLCILSSKDIYGVWVSDSECRTNCTDGWRPLIQIFSGQPARSMGGRDTREKIGEGERWRSSQEGTGLHFFSNWSVVLSTLSYTQTNTHRLNTPRTHISTRVTWSFCQLNVFQKQQRQYIFDSIWSECSNWTDCQQSLLNFNYFSLSATAAVTISQQFKCSILITHGRLPEFLIMPIKCWWNIDWRRGEMSAQGGRLLLPIWREVSGRLREKNPAQIKTTDKKRWRSTNTASFFVLELDRGVKENCSCGFNQNEKI